MNKCILEAEYAEIILELLGERYNIQSITKIVFISFCIKNEISVSYGTRKKDIVDTFFNNLSVKLLSHPEEVIAILEVINKLKSSGWIKVNSDEIEIIGMPTNITCNNKFLIGCRDKRINPIKEVNKLDCRAFTEEVLRHV